MEAITNELLLDLDVSKVINRLNQHLECIEGKLNDEDGETLINYVTANVIPCVNILIHVESSVARDSPVPDIQRVFDIVYHLLTKVCNNGSQNNELENLFTRACIICVKFIKLYGGELTGELLNHVYKSVCKLGSEQAFQERTRNINLENVHYMELHEKTLLQAEEEKKTDVNGLCLSHAIQLFSHLVDGAQEKPTENQLGNWRIIASMLLNLLGVVEERLVIRILLEILPKLSEFYYPKRDVVVAVWEMVQRISDEDEDGADVRIWVILGCVADDLFSSAGDDAVWMNPWFWKRIQRGLMHDNEMHRKRSLYFLKRALNWLENRVKLPELATTNCDIFIWKGENAREILKIFYDVILIMETVEEKQIHIMKPLYSHVLKLIEHTAGHGENCILHTSWIVVIFHGLLRHDTRTIRKWTLETICSLDFSRFPIFQQGTEQVFLKSFLEAINDTTLFSMHEFKNDELFIGNKLVNFWESCHHASKSLGKQETFFSLLLRLLRGKVWGSVPIVYLFRSLSLLPHYPQWGSKDIDHLREVLEYTTRTHDVFLRSSTQCFILETFFKLANPEDLTFSDLSTFFGLMKSEECLKRGTSSWNSTVSWLKNILTVEPTKSLNTNEAFTYLILNLEKLFKMDSNSEYDFDSKEDSQLVRLLILLFDCKILDSLNLEQSARLNSILMNPFTTLQSCSNRLYISQRKVDASLQFVSNLILLSKSIKNDDDADELIKWLISPINSILSEFLQFIKIKLMEMDNKNQENLDRYFIFLYQLLEISLDKVLIETFLHDVCQFQLIYFNDNLSTRQTQYVIAKCFQLFYSYVNSSPTRIKENEVLALEFIEICLKNNFLITVAPNATTQSFANQTHAINSNQLSSLYLSTLWDCLAHHLRLFTIPNLDLSILIDLAYSALDIGGTCCTKPVFKCLEIILPELITKNPDVAYDILEQCWKIVDNMNLNSHYWTALESFIDMAYQISLLENLRTASFLQQTATKLFTLSESTQRIAIQLFKRVAEIWESAENSLLIERNLNLFVNFLTFGYMYQKDLKVSQETITFLTYLGNGCTSNSILKSNKGTNAEIRSEAIVLLLKLSKKDGVSPIFGNLVTKLIEHEQKTTSEKTRHFANSKIHRTQQRVWQCLLVMEPVLDQVSVDNLLNVAFKKLVEDSIQPSVKFIVEWLIVKVLYDYPEKIVSFWNFIELEKTHRSGLLSGIFSIMYSLSIILNKVEQIQFIEKALLTILPWCVAAHQNTRIHAQVVLHKLWDFCKNIKLVEVTEKLTIIGNLVTSSAQSSRVGERQLFNNFRFSSFHSLEHFTFETVFYQVPRIFKVVQDEWIPASFFEKACGLHGIHTDIPIYNANLALSICDLQKNTEPVEENMYENELHKDVQKKITPWKSMFPDLEALKDSTTLNRKQNVKSDLIVIASLIDRPPNLGGLCRTCEIFGAGEYVIGNLAFVDDKQFQFLSVSAERWVQIKEVKINQLKEYLLSLKCDGYSVIGAEQTANSTKLTDYAFPKKTAIVLGNEKDGIPVDIIQLLDVAVEVPQQGIIRSLNVHVTGAILIWEYTRQHLFMKGS